MTQLNWTRVLLGTLVAAVIMFLSDGYFHESIVGQDWSAVYSRLGAAEPQHDASGITYFVIFEIGRAFTAIFLYALMRAFFGAGPKTAVIAAIVGWIAFSVTGPAQFVPLRFYSAALWWKVAAFQLVASVVAVLAGAALYRDA